MNDTLKDRRYLMRGRLGGGTYGEVCKAFDQDLQKDVALKIVKMEDREEEILMTIDKQTSDIGKYTVKLLDTFTHENKFRVYSQELLHCNLYSALELKFQNGYDLKNIASVGRQLCKALCLFENIKLKNGDKASLVHSDIKMDNVMFVDRKYKRIKFVDFGHSFYQNEHQSMPRQTKTCRAPECMFNGQTIQTTAIDMWSVGVMLFTMFFDDNMFHASTEEEQIANLVCVFGEPPVNLVHNKKNLDKFFNEKDGKLTLKTKYLAKAIQKTSFKKMFKKATKFPRHVNKEYANCLKDFYDLLLKMMSLDPSLRIKPQEAIKHPFFSLAEKKNVFTRLLERLKK